MMKKLLCAVIIAIFAVTAWAPKAHAALVWYKVDVLAIGINNLGVSVVQMTDTAGSPAFTATWFALDTAVTKEMMAVVLLALSLGQTVTIRTDLATGPLSVIDNAIINKPGN